MSDVSRQSGRAQETGQDRDGPEGTGPERTGPDAFGPERTGPERIGPYWIVGALGEGGMGAVHLGRDPHGRVAAVKVLRPELAGDAEMLRRFRREADTASAVRGPGVAAVLAHQLDGATPWIATEYLAGPTLHGALKATGPLPEPGVRALGAALAAGLVTIHAAGLVHRDLKPGNIVLTRDGPRIIDFGIARPEYGLTLTEPGAVAATPGYAPPEQVRGRRTGPAGDVFSLGAVLAFAATGSPLYGTGHPASVHYRVVYEEPGLDAVPPALEDLLRACLSREPAERPRPDVLVEALSAGGGGAPAPWRTGELAAEIARRELAAAERLAAAAPAPPAVPPPAGGGTPTRRRVLALSSAAGAVAVLAGAGWGGWRLLGGGAESGGGPGTSAADAIPAAAPVRRNADGSAPSPLWQAEGLRDDGPGPVVAGGVVAAGTRRGLAAWQQHTGERAWLWRWPDGGEPDSEEPDGEVPERGSKDPSGDAGAPAVLGAATPDGPLLCATGGGRLTALDAKAGRRRWSTREADAREVLAAGGDRAYVLDGERRVRAVRLTDGAQRWRSAGSVAGKGRVAAALSGGSLLVVGSEGEAVALDAGTGKVRWRRRLWKPSDARRAGHAEPGALTPAALDGAFCVGGRELAVLDAREGTERWTRPAQAVLWGTPTVASGRVYVSGGDQITCWDAKSGRQRWTAGLSHGGLSERPAVVLGHALYEALGAVPVVGDGTRVTDSGVATVDVRDGARAWTLSDDRPVAGWHLAGAAGRVFVRRRGVLRAMPVL